MEDRALHGPKFLGPARFRPVLDEARPGRLAIPLSVLAAYTICIKMECQNVAYCINDISHRQLGIL